jgi:hypothetical protein
MKNENYHFLTVLAVFLMLLCVFPFRLQGQERTLFRLQTPPDSAQQPVKLAQIGRSARASRVKKADTSTDTGSTYPGDEYLMSTYNKETSI